MSQFPKYLYSSILNEIFVAQNDAEIRQLATRHSFRERKLHNLMAYPKQLRNERTGETRIATSFSDEEWLTADWVNDSPREVTDFPKAMYSLADGRWLAVKSAEEEAVLPEGWVNGHEYFSNPVHAKHKSRELSFSERDELLAVKKAKK